MLSGVPGSRAPETFWKARLELKFGRREGRTALIKRLHTGPLTVQKALYPEGPEICHAVIIHPPGGIAGGDQLKLDIGLEENSRAVLSTPASTKWYKAPGHPSSQEINIRLDSGATLDWLPQENLFFDASHAESRFRLVIAPDATAIGWEAIMLGRQASKEAWVTGSIRLATEISRPCGEMLWVDRMILPAGSALLGAPQALDGFKLFGLLWAIGPSCTRELAEELAKSLPSNENLRAGVTCLPNGVLLIRVLSDKIEALRRILVNCWMRLRPIINGLTAQPLRLWAT
jgi:urease accessory protein